MGGHFHFKIVLLVFIFDLFGSADAFLVSPSPGRSTVDTGVVSRWTAWRVSTNILVDSVRVSSTTVSTQEREILRPLILVDEKSGEILAKGHELRSLPEERNRPDEDELEMLYPTQRQYFQFGGSSIHPVQIVRTTSFGCGKLGHQIWPSALALSLALVREFGIMSKNIDPIHRPRSVLELGAGCGLPSVVCRDVLQLPVTATDFWYEGQGSVDRDMDRLIPEVYHGINLRYNVIGAAPTSAVSTRFGGGQERESTPARVELLDWHKIETVQKIGPIDLVIGSDVIYYPMDIEPLWKTMESLLKDGGASKIILMLPLKPDQREALPAFMELLEKKSSSEGCEYRLEIQEVCLYKSTESMQTKEDGAHFVKLSLSMRQTR